MTSPSLVYQIRLHCIAFTRQWDIRMKRLVLIFSKFVGLFLYKEKVPTRASNKEMYSHGFLYKEKVPTRASNKEMYSHGFLYKEKVPTRASNKEMYSHGFLYKEKVPTRASNKEMYSHGLKSPDTGKRFTWLNLVLVVSLKYKIQP